MRTTINLEPEAYRLARAIATQRHESLGKVLSESILNQFRTNERASEEFRIDSDGFPRLTLGRVITPEDVAEAIEEE